MYLAHTEDDLRRLSRQGHCVAVPLAVDDPQVLEQSIPHMIGEIVAAFDGERKPEPPDEDEMSEHE